MTPRLNLRDGVYIAESTSMICRLVAMENVYFLRPEIGWEERCAGIAAAGYGGVYVVPYPLIDGEFHRLRQLGDAPRRHGLKVSAVYANLDLAQPAESGEFRRLRRLFEEVEDTPRIELSVKCSDRSLWPTCVEDAVCTALPPLLEIADRRGLRVALYPHSFYPLERIAQVKSILRRIAHPTLEYIFPVSHAFAVDALDRVLADLTANASKAASINVCGCRRTGPIPSKCQHLPLDEGDVPVAAVAASLKATGYSREIIVQGHGWPGDPDEYLRRSRAALVASLAG